MRKLFLILFVFTQLASARYVGAGSGGKFDKCADHMEQISDQIIDWVYGELNKIDKINPDIAAELNTLIAEMKPEDFSISSLNLLLDEAMQRALAKQRDAAEKARGESGGAFAVPVKAAAVFTAQELARERLVTEYRRLYSIVGGVYDDPTSVSDADLERAIVEMSSRVRTPFSSKPLAPAHAAMESGENARLVPARAPAPIAIAAPIVEKAAIVGVLAECFEKKLNQAENGVKDTVAEFKAELEKLDVGKLSGVLDIMTADANYPAFSKDPSIKNGSMADHMATKMSNQTRFVIALEYVKEKLK